MTSGLKSRYYTDTNDGDILDELLGAVQPRPRRRRDHAVARRRSSSTTRPTGTSSCAAPRPTGTSSRSRDGKVTVGPPATDAEPVVTAQFGATVLELDAEIDARWQVKGVTAKSLERHRPGARLGRRRPSRR